MTTQPCVSPTLERSQAGVVGRHFLVVVGAAVAAAAVYLVAHHLLDLDLDDADPTRLTLGTVLWTSALGAALGWTLLMALQRWTTRARTLWTRVAVGVAAVSLLGPLTTPDLTPAGRVVAVVLHLVVAAITIGVLRPRAFDRTAPD